MRRRRLSKPMLGVSCLVLFAACLDESSDPGATGRAAVVDMFSPWPGDESLRTAAEPSLVVGSDESLPLGRVSGAVFFGDGMEVMTEFRLRLLEDLPARPTLPAFSAMKGGADGLLWIREYPDPLQDQVIWVGFSEAWERKKRITMPVRLNVLDISEDRVLVRAKGAHDETLIEVYPIER